MRQLHLQNRMFSALNIESWIYHCITVKELAAEVKINVSIIETTNHLKLREISKQWVWQTTVVQCETRQKWTINQSWETVFHSHHFNAETSGSAKSSPLIPWIYNLLFSSESLRVVKNSVLWKSLKPLSIVILKNSTQQIFNIYIAFYKIHLSHWYGSQTSMTPLLPHHI